MKQISNETYSILCSKLPVVISTVGRTGDVHIDNSVRMLRIVLRKLSKNR